MATGNEQVEIGKRIRANRTEGATWKQAAAAAGVSVSGAKRAVKAAEEQDLVDQTEEAFADDEVTMEELIDDGVLEAPADEADQVEVPVDQVDQVEAPVEATDEELQADREFRFSGLPAPYRALDEVERIQAQRIQCIVEGNPIPSRLYDVRVKTGLEIARAHYVRGKLKLAGAELSDSPTQIAALLLDMRARGG